MLIVCMKNHQPDEDSGGVHIPHALPAEECKQGLIKNYRKERIPLGRKVRETGQQEVRRAAGAENAGEAGSAAGGKIG